MQGGQGRGGGRQGYNFGPGYGMSNNHQGAITYGGMPGYVFNNWVPYSDYHMQSFMPMQPIVPRPVGRGSTPGGFVPLGVQGAGILKRPAGHMQGQNAHGRSGRNRGHNGRSWGNRDRARKNLTKEALDADLDEYRMKDKKIGGQSLDAELDEYWKKKSESDLLPQEDDDIKEMGEGSESGEEGIKDEKIPVVGTTSSHHKDGDKQSGDGKKMKGQVKES